MVQADSEKATSASSLKITLPLIPIRPAHQQDQVGEQKTQTVTETLWLTTVALRPLAASRLVRWAIIVSLTRLHFRLDDRRKPAV